MTITYVDPVKALQGSINDKPSLKPCTYRHVGYCSAYRLTESKALFVSIIRLLYLYASICSLITIQCAIYRYYCQALLHLTDRYLGLSLFRISPVDV